MNTPKMLFAVAAVLAPALALAGAARVEAGDGARGAALFRLHCAACHGAGAGGDGVAARSLTAKPPTNLRDTAFLMQRSDADLVDAITRGGAQVKASFAMPAFGAQLATLDTWDLVAFLRKGQPTVNDYFPTAARLCAKTYTIDANGQKRLTEVMGKLTDEELKTPLVIAFSGEKPEDGAVYVPQEPRLLDTLKPKLKLGYLAFMTVTLPGVATPVPVAVVLGKDGAIQALKPSLEVLSDAKERARAEKLLAGWEGQGSKRAPYKELKPPKAPAKEAKDWAEVAKGVTRAYYRVVEGAQMFDKEEAERHWAE
jgi:mono/diheme cytochrome c family protein